MTSTLRRVLRSIRWRLGLPMAAEALEIGSDARIVEFYDSRITRTSALIDENHYEHPRVKWALDEARKHRGSLLEIGSGDGALTEILARHFESVVALDVSARSLRVLESKGIPNVECVAALVEKFKPSRSFDCILMSEIVEHLRKPRDVVEACLGWLSPGGALVITTPCGHWESDEHLHEFDMFRLLQLVSSELVEQASIGYIRDRDNRRRWLRATLTTQHSRPARDGFFGMRGRRATRSRRA